MSELHLDASPAATSPVSGESASPAATSLADALEVLRQARRQASSTIAVVLPAPVASDVVALWGDSGDAVLWHAPEHAPIAGIGAAAVLAPEGDGRFAALRDAAAAVLSTIEVVAGDAPRFFGGLAFSSGDAADSPWQEFGDARFVLPRWTYGIDGGEAWLRYVGDVADDAAEVELEQLWERLEADASAPLRGGIASTEHQDFESYEAALVRITDAIADGRLEKVALARRADFRLSAELDPRTVLRRLRERFGGCTRFAMRSGQATFVAATPERLVQRDGSEVRSVALAGSVARGQAASMIASAKEQHEHRVVVKVIVDALQPFCESLDASPEPAVRELPDVLHLQTPIAGRLRQPGAHVLELAAALHPTPAVGGTPAPVAQVLIAQEAQPRGWYAAPFGWFDGEGNGELVVGLRSGVLRGTKAWAWAGGGIVAGSKAKAEYDESALKLRAMLWALGDEAAC